MPVYKDENAKKNKWYYNLNYTDEKGKKKVIKKRGFKTEKEAKAALAEAENALNKGTYVQPSKMKFSELLEQWLNDKKVRVKKSTYSTYKALVDHHIVPELGDYNLSKLTPRIIQDQYNELFESEALCGGNIQKVHTIIKDALNKALRWELVSKNVADLVDRPKAVAPEIQVWDQEDSLQFLRTAYRSRYYIAFLLALTTGMRKGEILGLRWQDINFEKRIISVIQTQSHDGKDFTGTKSAAGKRVIAIDQDTIAALLHWRDRVKKEMKDRQELFQLCQDNGLVVCTSVGTKQNQRNLSRSFQSILKQARVKKIRFHDMRHTHATLLLLQGVNPKIVSERLGHANVRITLDTYSHMLPNMQHDMADKFGAFFFQSQEGQRKLG